MGCFSISSKRSASSQGRGLQPEDLSESRATGPDATGAGGQNPKSGQTFPGACHAAMTAGRFIATATDHRLWGWCGWAVRRISDRTSRNAQAAAAPSRLGSWARLARPSFTMPMGIPSLSDAAPMGGMIICRHAAFPAMAENRRSCTTGYRSCQPASQRSSIRAAVTRARFFWGTTRSGRYARREAGCSGIMLLKNLTFGAGPDGGPGHVWGQINCPCASNPGWFRWRATQGTRSDSAGSLG